MNSLEQKLIEQEKMQDPNYIKMVAKELKEAMDNKDVDNIVLLKYSLAVTLSCSPEVKDKTKGVELLKKFLFDIENENNKTFYNTEQIKVSELIYYLATAELRLKRFGDCKRNTQRLLRIEPDNESFKQLKRLVDLKLQQKEDEKLKQLSTVALIGGGLALVATLIAKSR